MGARTCALNKAASPRAGQICTIADRTNTSKIACGELSTYFTPLTTQSERETTHSTPSSSPSRLARYLSEIASVS